MDLRRVFDCMISVSELGRGQASKVIQLVEETGNPYIVVKNNKPQAVILSIDDYTDLMKAKETLKSMENTVHLPSYQKPRHYDSPEARLNSLSEDEINIFLSDEEGD